MLLVSTEEMRRLDRLTIEQYGTPGRVLMERAGRGAVEALLKFFPHVCRARRRILVCAGTGNNGGDGFVMARHLRRGGVRADVVLIGTAAKVRGDAARNLRAFACGRGRVVEVKAREDLGLLVERVGAAHLVVDALFGTGLKRPVRGLHADAVEIINSSGVPVFAVDIASGLNADTGQPMGCCIQAEATATFGFAKIGQMLFPGALYTGELAVVDIGLAAEAVAKHPPATALSMAEEIAGLLPVRRPDAHKGDAGHALVIAGSLGKTGAAQLAARGALRGGAGLVTLVAPASLYPVYVAGVLEAMTAVLPDRGGRVSFSQARLRSLVAGKSAVVVGPGLGTHADARRIVRWLLSRGGIPVVADADALTCVAEDLHALHKAAAPVVLTPHPGEMGRLLGTTAAEVQADRVGTACRFAAQYGCTLVLKGARTVTADASGRAWVNATGNPGMASGGMGDVLSGIVGALLAQGLTAAEAARLGVYLHGAAADRIAGERGEVGLLASDVADELPATVHSLRRRLHA